MSETRRRLLTARLAGVGNRDEHILTRVDQLDLGAIGSFSSSLREEAEHVVAAVAVPFARFPPEQLDVGIEQLFVSGEVAVLPALQNAIQGAALKPPA